MRAPYGRGKLQQTNPVTNEHNWRKVESALVSAIMGKALNEEDERPPERHVEPLERPVKSSLQPRPPKKATQADIHHLDKMVAVLREELALHRSEVQRLHVLMRREAGGESRYLRRHGDTWWRKFWLRAGY
jgi:hypothetical protein